MSVYVCVCTGLLKRGKCSERSLTSCGDMVRAQPATQRSHRLAKGAACCEHVATLVQSRSNRLSKMCICVCVAWHPQVKDIVSEYYPCRNAVLGPLHSDPQGNAADVPGDNFRADIKPCFGETCVTHMGAHTWAHTHVCTHTYPLYLPSQASNAEGRMTLSVRVCASV